MQTYIRLLNLLQGITDLEIDLVAEKVLDRIALAHANGKPLTITRAMEMHDIASPATIHRKLNMLIEADLIKQDFEGKNRRTKYLTPTVRAEEHFTRLGGIIKSATN